MTRSDLAALRSKYEEMLRLRLADDTADGGDPRREMAALASMFPGALREIDELPLDAIRDRIAAVRDAEAGGDVPVWMTATHLFHALARGALCVKKWLAGRKAIDDALLEAFDREAGALRWSDEARLWRDELAPLASPPGGRVSGLVYARVGAHLDLSAESVRALVFNVRRRV